jgi:hypothetical protein
LLRLYICCQLEQQDAEAMEAASRLARELARVEGERASLKEALRAEEESGRAARDDLALTRRSYEEQMRMLSEEVVRLQEAAKALRATRLPCPACRAVRPLEALLAHRALLLQQQQQQQQQQ